MGLLMPLGYSSEASAVAKIQPTLAEIAAESPNASVRVIIQKADQSYQAERLVAKHGGTYLKKLGFIHGFVAQIPVSAVLQLANSTAVNWVSLDSPVVSTGKPVPTDTTKPSNFYLDTLNVRPVWELGYTGAGIGIAVIDSGISNDPDLNVVVKTSFNPNSNSVNDVYGHGTHVAGIIGGDGTDSAGFYQGIAPDAQLISLKISDAMGLAYESDTVDAMQWVYDNKDTYNIRVVNLSIQSTVEQSYHESALSAAAEILWFNGIVVTAATGNWYGGAVYPLNAAPSNDPFVITVGALDEQGTAKTKDDRGASFSVWGLTQDGFIKPDISAPGVDIISVMSKDSDWDSLYPERTVFNGQYFRISGTSMATPMVSGAVALLLQAEPDLTPDQVKYRIMHTFHWAGVIPVVDVYQMLITPTTESANQDVIPHRVLAQMAMIAYWASAEGEENIDWENVDWAAVNWNAVNWNAVNWNAVNWNAVNWNAVNWNAVNWNAVNWNAVNWNAVNWNAVNWNAVNWTE